MLLDCAAYSRSSQGLNAVLIFWDTGQQGQRQAAWTERVVKLGCTIASLPRQNQYCNDVCSIVLLSASLALNVHINKEREGKRHANIFVFLLLHISRSI